MAYYDFDLPSIFRLFGYGGEEDLPRASSAGLSIYETKGELVVEAPVPGVKKDEVTVEVADGMIKIDAVHQETEEDKKEKTAVYRAQRMTEFHYSTTLPKEVEEKQARAKMEDGILRVRVPLKAGAKEKKSTIPVEGE
ncbi:MAG TPA: Hsp20/alpha crystallin family protein [Patescibacteria group bacterium]|nr:Hsp20/alpha crystallin family protein [Patescibacteria group bacterium]